MLNPLLVPLAAHQAIRTVLQTIANLFKEKLPQSDVGYVAVAPERRELALHPGRVVRFLGTPLLYGSQLWSDSVMQAVAAAPLVEVELEKYGVTKYQFFLVPKKRYGRKVRNKLI